MCHAMRLRRYILRLLWLRPCIVIINISLTFTFLYFQMIVGDILIIYWFTPYLISFYIYSHTSPENEKEEDQGKAVPWVNTGGVVKAPPRDCYVSNKKIVAAAEFLRRTTQTWYNFSYVTSSRQNGPQHGFVSCIQVRYFTALMSRREIVTWVTIYLSWRRSNTQYFVM